MKSSQPQMNFLSVTLQLSQYILAKKRDKRGRGLFVVKKEDLGVPFLFKSRKMSAKSLQTLKN